MAFVAMGVFLAEEIEKPHHPHRKYRRRLEKQKILWSSIVEESRMNSTGEKIQKNCCDTQANDAEGCNKVPEGHPCPPDAEHCSFDNCVGAVGVDCEGVQTDIDFGPLGALTVDLVKPKDNGDGTVDLKVNVGSILHDLCCMDHSKGAFCTSTNYPVGALVNSLGNADNECACLMEMRKAVWNVLHGRYWTHTFPTAKQSSDNTLVPDLSRKSFLPLGWVGVSTKEKSDWGIKERKSTAMLCAPEGTKLDCPDEDDNCKIGRCVRHHCVSCKDCDNKISKSRWNKNGRDHAHAGDSDYCCSGEFKEVHFVVLPAPARFGVCSAPTGYTED